MLIDLLVRDKDGSARCRAQEATHFTLLAALGTGEVGHRLCASASLPPVRAPLDCSIGPSLFGLGHFDTGQSGQEAAQ